MIKDYKGKIAVITGAGNGIGKCLALGCAERGAKVLVVDIHGDDAEQTVTEIEENNGEAIALQADVSLSEDCQKIFDTCMEKFGRCDILINNAGVSALGEVTEATELDIQWVTSVNYFAHFYMMRRFIPQMVKQESHCQILNVCSIAGIITSIAAPIYFSTKHAAVALSEATYKFIKSRGYDIDISVFCPGFVQTEMYLTDRHRPDRFAINDDPFYHSELYQKYSELNKKVLSGGKTLEEVIPQVFEALDKEQFYILTHPQYDALIRKQGEFEADMNRPIDYADVAKA